MSSTLLQIKNILSSSTDLKDNNIVVDDDWWRPKPDKVVEKHSEFDVLAASQALYRIFDKDSSAQGSRGLGRWMEFTDSELFGLIKEEDHVVAKNIREYYAKQLIVSSLQSERPFSKYMSQLASIVNSSGNVYSNENTGIYYRLPEYYSYDISWDAMIDQHFTGAAPDYSRNDVANLRLQPLSKMTRKNRTERTVELWFSIVETGQPVCLQLQLSNSLGYIVEHLFDKRKEMKISITKPHLATRRGTTFLMSDKWKITNLESL